MNETDDGSPVTEMVPDKISRSRAVGEAKVNALYTAFRIVSLSTTIKSGSMSGEVRAKGPSMNGSCAPVTEKQATEKGEDD